MGTEGPGLSAREREIACLVAEGLTNGAIARRLFISERTVESHLERARRKLGFHSRSEIAAWIARGAGGISGDAAAAAQPAADAGDDRARPAHDRQRRADERDRRADAREERADRREASLDEREHLLWQRRMPQAQ